MLTTHLENLLRSEIRPALGCTEPAAVALACAVAAKHLDGEVESVLVQTDPNVFKNGMGVYIPCTNHTGLFFAAALGSLSARPELELEVLTGCQTHLERAKQMISEGRVMVTPNHPKGALRISALVKNGNSSALAEIEGSHTHLARIIVNDKLVFENKGAAESIQTVEPKLHDYGLRELLAACLDLSPETYEFIWQCAKTNQAVANAGLEMKLGLGLGWHYERLMNMGSLAKDVANLAMMMTAAAADARMSGWEQPVFSTNGSGNQGITASLPVLTVGEHLGIDKNQISEALAISQTVTIYVKQHIGKLSALCACAVAAALGASCGIAHLLGCSPETAEQSIKIMVANLTGMICDGAKVSCSLKLATAAAFSVQSAMLAEGGLVAPVGEGIIAESIEETIKNLGTVSNPGMVETDRVILDVMMHKK